ncbi:hypothetical protein C8A01DRAFT_14948 [Parachaetomium inaequale]|uniref:SRR1-like domain-containing protein n=1 Tax=Parachaetomium inaequale TaxID=2588326 RepID=A0AAN6PJV2_9PEZI|nr:hypothetical protein C8A01DRAFT_14948 [Parachaetomium inaequale]
MDATGTFDAAQILDAKSTFNAPTVPRDGQATASRAETRAKIQAKYDAGAPLYTKDDFRRVVEVFDRAMLEGGMHEHRLAVRGIDGVRVRFVLKVGAFASIKVPGKDTTLKFILQDVRIKHHSIEMMTGRNNSSSDADLPLAVAALPFSVVHTGAMVNKTTGQTMAGRPAPWDWRDSSAVAARLAMFWPGWEITETCSHVWAIFLGLVPVVVDRSVLARADVVCLPGVIDKVVAFGCGSMAAADRESEKRVGVQHALVLSVRHALLARANRRRAYGWAAVGEVRCYAQDAGYQPTDRGGLAEVGITVLEDPRGLLEVDSTSVVVSFAPDLPLRQIVADIARPAALIWPRVTDADGGPQCDPVSPRVRRMIKDYYVAVECPFDEPEWKSSNPVVYIRKTLPWTLWGGVQTNMIPLMLNE